MSINHQYRIPSDVCIPLSLRPRGAGDSQELICRLASKKELHDRCCHRTAAQRCM